MKAELEPDPRWAADLSGRSLPEAVRAIREAAEDRRLFGHLARQHAREGRDSYVEIDAPLELYAIVRLTRPRHVVEVGVSSGVSSAYLLEALVRNRYGALHSVDLPKFEAPRPTGAAPTSSSWSLPPGRGPGWAVPPRLWSAWDLRIGDKRDVLPMLAEQLPRVDLLVYDVPHACHQTTLELRSLASRFHQGTIVIIDHGSDGTRCPALARLAQERHTRTVRRAGTGLYGARLAR